MLMWMREKKKDEKWAQLTKAQKKNLWKKQIGHVSMVNGYPLYKWDKKRVVKIYAARCIISLTLYLMKNKVIKVLQIAKSYLPTPWKIK